MNSIFRLEEIRGYEPDGHLYRDAAVGILGHYSSLEYFHQRQRTTFLCFVR